MSDATRASLRQVPVLIVVGGPVGLALASELGRQGAACELIEEGDGVVTTPKMNEINTRAMEFCRRRGIVDACGKAPGTFFIPVDAGGVWANLRIIDPATALWRLMVNEAGPGTRAAEIDKDSYLRRGVGRARAVDDRHRGSC